MFIPLALMSLYLAQLQPGRTPAQCHVKHDYRLRGTALYSRDEMRYCRRYLKARHSNHAVSKPRCRRLQARLTPSWCPPRRVWSALEMV